MIAGFSTSDTLLTINDPFPNCDIPANEFSDLTDYGEKVSGDITEVMRIIEQIYTKHGYTNIHTVADAEFLRISSQIYNNNVFMMAPYINEYTFDIIPMHPLSPEIEINIRGQEAPSILEEKLSRRKATLPANGMVFRFQNVDIVKEILLKETLIDNSIYLLFRLSTDEGDISGLFDTKSKYSYTPFCNSNRTEYHQTVMQLVLWCYAVCVMRDYAYTLSTFSNYFCVTEQATVTMYSNGKRLVNVYRLKNEMRKNGDKGRNSRVDNDRYVAEERGVNGYVRRLPEGQKCSEAAQLAAEAVGLYLENGETYVQPFFKRVYKMQINK